MGATQRGARSRKSAQWETIAAFAFGVIFVTALLVLAVKFPEPTPFQYTVFRIVLAVACAGVASVIPGILRLRIGRWLTAGGALAVFVIAYFYSPASLVVTHPLTSEPASMNFGLDKEDAALTLRTESQNALLWRLESKGPLRLREASGRVSSETPQAVQAVLDRGALKKGPIQDTLVIAYSEHAGTDHYLRIPFSALEVDDLEYRFEHADDRLEIWVNGSKIDESSGTSDWKPIPRRNVNEGKNSVTLKIFNAATRRGEFGPREGWNYNVGFRYSGHVDEFSDRNDEPGAEQWGTTFVARELSFELDGKTGKLSLVGNSGNPPLKAYAAPIGKDVRIARWHTFDPSDRTRQSQMAQEPGCDCGRSDIAISLLNPNVRVGQSARVKYDGSPICHGQTIRNFSGTVHWTPSSSEAIPEIFGYLDSPPYEVAGNASIQIAISAECHDNGCFHACPASGSIPIRVLPAP